MRTSAGGATVDLGTYRTPTGELIHCWYEASGVLRAERDGPHGREWVDARTLVNAVKLSDDPYWPDHEAPVQGVLWED